MADETSKKPDGDDVEPTVLEEPTGSGGTSETDWDSDENSVWLRGLWMILFAIFFGLAEALLWLLAIVQFLWLLFAKEKNVPIAEFGEDVADWVARITKFQTGATEDKPFPFTKWGKADT